MPQVANSGLLFHGLMQSVKDLATALDSTKVAFMKTRLGKIFLLFFLSSSTLGIACNDHAKAKSKSSPIARTTKSISPTAILDIEERSQSVTPVCKTKACTIPEKKTTEPVRSSSKAR
jgi:hypothetical protein